MADDLEVDDIGADIAKAMAEHAAPDGVQPIAVIPDPNAAPPISIPKADEGQARAPDGKFAPKAADALSIPPIAADAPGEPEAVKPPASYSAAAKAEFKTWPVLAQQEAIRREREMDKGLQDRATELKKYQPLEDVLSPHRDRLAMAGTDEATYIRSLIAADRMLSDPATRMAALGQIARSYGINLGQPPQGQQPQQGALPPELQGLFQEVSTLKQALAQRDQAQANQQQAAIQAEIQAFTNKPDVIYYDNVKPMMADLLSTGHAKSLDQAYQMACMASDEIRPLILKDQREAETKRAAEEAKVKAATAKRAGGSITGSPGIGAPVVTANQNSSIEDDVRAAFAASSGRV